MKEQILALLKAQFSGVRADGLSVLAGSLALQAASEDEAKEIVGKLTADKVNSFISDWRKEADSEISKANKTYEDNLKKKFDFVEKKTDDTTPPAPAPNHPQNLEKVIQEAVAKVVQPLQQELESIKAKETVQGRKQRLLDAIKEAPESFKSTVTAAFDSMNFTDDQAFEGYLTVTKTNADALVQEITNKGLAGHSAPIFGNGGAKTEEDNFVEAMKEVNATAE
ncbi:hypothetical protein [Leadbetterella byssophila]|uniref:hypothetical protein n=1 Tax=Leadbetterella byssophila TaxID=316068 RepID=UPI0039A300A3